MDVIKCYEKNQKRPFKILISLYKGTYLKLILSAVCFAIKHTPAWVLPIITANIINIATSPLEHNVYEIYINVVIMVILVLQNIFSNYYHTKFHSLAIRYVEAELRSALVKKLQQLSILYHKEMQSGRLQSKIMRDVEAVEILSAQLFVSSLNIIINLAVALGVTLYKSKTVFTFFLMTVPIAAIVTVVFRGKIKKRNKDFRLEMEETSAKVMEMVEMLPVTRAHALEKQEISKMNRQLAKVSKKGLNLDLIQSLFGSTSWAVFQIFQLICLVFTGTLAYYGKITVGDVVLYQTYFTTVVNQVSGIIMLIPTISKGLESVNSVGEILLAHDIECNSKKKEVSHVNGEFVFENIEYQYPSGKKNILNGLNLQIAKGETMAFVGESGAGKSTILNIIIGFILPTGGKVYLDGNDITQIDLRSYRKYLAVVPQNTILFSGTIRDNITYGMSDISEERLEKVVQAANLSKLIKELPEGLETWIGENGGKLSGGQRQRIAIARAIIRNPKVIVLDEATSALDSISEKKIQSALNNLKKGRTTFIVAHRLSTIQDSDRIAVIKEGKCVEIGTYDELMELKKEFYNLKKQQV
ncbi:putative multidrug export ATP-binding/permease protein [Clostridium puniceum]|uniref:Putative multidrug export ATP-binding/permease protein n=1 Tax=Clostridium puniceum TaxID=29367 RepID=A0A1S8TM53_9CLOT|nr:ABC transporter ATP-binding protein [Clostridium puniceum]OOM78791.1 putative multidrug export ATP-binding/permease protein [Clostridium puniceum]